MPRCDRPEQTGTDAYKVKNGKLWEVIQVHHIPQVPIVSGSHDRKTNCTDI